MAWKIVFPDERGVVEFDDLTPETFEGIADAEETSWYDVYSVPAKSSARFQRIVAACAVSLGIDVPEPPTNMREFNRRINDWLEQTESVEDKPMMDGFPQMPGDPESGSTSGSSGDSVGPSTSSDDNALATS